MSGDLRRGGESHPAKFLTFEKELKKRLQPGIVVYAFSPSTLEAEASIFLSMRPPGWPSKVYERNPLRQKAGEDVIP